MISRRVTACPAGNRVKPRNQSTPQQSPQHEDLMLSDENSKPRNRVTPAAGCRSLQHVYQIADLGYLPSTLTVGPKHALDSDTMHVADAPVAWARVDSRSSGQKPRQWQRDGHRRLACQLIVQRACQCRRLREGDVIRDKTRKRCRTLRLLHWGRGTIGQAGDVNIGADELWVLHSLADRSRVLPGAALWQEDVIPCRDNVLLLRPC